MVIALTGKGKGPKYSNENVKNAMQEVVAPKKANRKVSLTPLKNTSTTVNISVADETYDSNAVTSDKLGQMDTSSVSHETNATVSKTRLLQESSDDSSTSSEEDTMEEYLKMHKRRAKKLEPKEAVAEIVKLHEKIWLSEEMFKTKNDDFTEQLNKVQSLLVKAKTENDALQNQLVNARAKLLHANNYSNGVSLPVNEALKEKIETYSKTILWSMTKFIQSKKEEVMAAKMLLKYADQFLQEHVPTKDARIALVNTYKGTIRRAIFARRNYVAAEHKKAMLKRFNEKGSMPSVAQLLKCLKREIVTETDFEIFEFYWEELLPKQVGSLVWSKDVRNYNTICGAMRRDVPGLPTVTRQDEAFTVLVVENSYERWENEFKSKKAAKRSQKVNDKRTNHNGVFTTTDSGQSEWGGWSIDGRTKYAEYVEMNKAARKLTSTQVLEATCLNRLREKYNITCHDHKSQSDLERSNKRKRKLGQAEIASMENKHKEMLTFDREYVGDLESDDEDNNTAFASLSCKYKWCYMNIDPSISLSYIWL